MIQSFSEALAPSSRVRGGSAVWSTDMSMTMRNKALDTTSRTSQRFVGEAVTALPPTSADNVLNPSPGEGAPALALGALVVSRGEDVAQLELEKDVPIDRIVADG